MKFKQLAKLKDSCEGPKQQDLTSNKDNSENTKVICEYLSKHVFKSVIENLVPSRTTEPDSKSDLTFR